MLLAQDPRPRRRAERRLPPFDTSRCADPPPPAVLKGIEQYNRGEYWEAHETLEGAWIAEPNDVRNLYQGILQVGVAFHHLGRANYHGVVALLRRGIPLLEPFAPVCQGIAVGRLLEGARRCLAEAERLGPARLAEFDRSLIPRIEIDLSWGQRC